MLDYPALAAVSAIISEGSFERAAGVLGISPSAVSQRVRTLEERLGAILIVRGQPCILTNLGQTLMAHFERVRLLEDELGPELVHGQTHSRLPLKVAVNSDSLATWFPEAAKTFGEATGTPLDILLDDEGHTVERLRSGEVLAAVTAETGEVPGCRKFPLGSLKYMACASPEFVQRYFADGVDADGLAKAPCLRFDRRDDLQAQWVKQTLNVALDAPIYSVASTHGFLDLAAAGLAWGMQPVGLAEPRIAEGTLVELVPDTRLAVPLNWIVSRLPVASLGRLTDAIRSTAKVALR